MLGNWLQEHTHIRDRLVQQRTLDVPFCREIVNTLDSAIKAVGREHPVPQMSARKLARLAKEAAIAEAQQEQEREAAGLQALQASPAVRKVAPSQGMEHRCDASAGGESGTSAAQESSGTQVPKPQTQEARPAKLARVGAGSDHDRQGAPCP